MQVMQNMYNCIFYIHCNPLLRQILIHENLARKTFLPQKKSCKIWLIFYVKINSFDSKGSSYIELHVLVQCTLESTGLAFKKREK
jgi:hypothetical protein